MGCRSVPSRLTYASAWQEEFELLAVLDEMSRDVHRGWGSIAVSSIQHMNSAASGVLTRLCP